MRYKTLIIGLGQIGMGYDLNLDPAYVYSHARAFSMHPNFHLIGGVDSDISRCETFEKVYQCPTYIDVRTALHHHQPELIIIAVPTKFHSDILRQVIEQSQPMAVLCEKPLSYDLEEAQVMLASCEDRGIKLFVNYMRRSDPGANEVKRRIDSGEIDMPLKGVVWYSKGFLHNGSHFFNLLEYWLGSMSSAEIIAPGRLWKGSDPEPDVSVSFKRGSVIFLAAWEEEFSHCTVEIVARNGRLRYEKGGQQILWQAARSDSNLKGYTVLSSEIDQIGSGMVRYQWHVAEQLLGALRGQNFSICSGVEGLLTLNNMQTILEKL